MRSWFLAGAFAVGVWAVVLLVSLATPPASVRAAQPRQQEADLSLAKTVSNPTPNVGDTITFTITLTNLRPEAATGVTVTDLLPSSLSFMSAAASEGSYDPTTGQWTVGSVGVGAPLTLTIEARVLSPDPTTNTASVTHADQLDPDQGNDSASVTVSPQQADLRLIKTVNNPTPNVGDTVTLANDGPDTATNVAVTDRLAGGLSFVTATPSQGSYDPATGVWTSGTVTPRISQTLLIQAVVLSPDPATNTATVTQSDQFDPDTGNKLRERDRPATAGG